jgi:hypothetical protein
MTSEHLHSYALSRFWVTADCLPCRCVATAANKATVYIHMNTNTFIYLHMFVHNVYRASVSPGFAEHIMNIFTCAVRHLVEQFLENSRCSVTCDAVGWRAELVRDERGCAGRGERLEYLGDVTGKMVDITGIMHAHTHTHSAFICVIRYWATS